MGDLLDKLDNVSGVSKQGNNLSTPAPDPRFKVTPLGDYALDHQEIKPGPKLEVIQCIQRRHMPTVKEITNTLPGLSESSVKSIITSLHADGYVARC